MYCFDRKIAIALMASVLLAQQAPREKEGDLTIVVLAGDKAINILDDGSAVTPVVEIHDKEGTPVADARVTFELPSGHPRVAGSGNKPSIKALTDANGRAGA